MPPGGCRCPGQAGAVLQALFTGSHRFADIRAAIPGVSDIMLTRRLRELEAAGLVERRVIAASPVHVEYHLTQMGREARPVLDAVIAWSHEWITAPGRRHRLHSQPPASA